MPIGPLGGTKDRSPKDLGHESEELSDTLGRLKTGFRRGVHPWLDEPNLERIDDEKGIF